MDVTIAAPDIDAKSDWNPYGATDRAKKVKDGKYAKWDMNPADSITLGFSTFGVWSKPTFRYLQTMAGVIGGADKVRRELVFRRLREDIACRLVKANGKIIHEFNRRNGGYLKDGASK